MFEQFTERALNVINLAKEEMKLLGHNFIGSEAILLGLIAEDGISARALEMMGINLNNARVEVEKIIGHGSGFLDIELPFTPRTKRMLELSMVEASQLGHNYIEPEHILLGLIRESNGIAVRVIENLGVDLNNLKIYVLKMLNEIKNQNDEIISIGASDEINQPQNLFNYILHWASNLIRK